jgi:hypothetical protein
MHPQSRLSLFTILLLIISFGNFYGIGVGLWHNKSDSETVSDTWGTMAIVFLAFNQMLYLVFVFAWLFQWMRFYPGNPVQGASVCCGFALSVASIVMACCGLGLKRVMGIAIAVTTALLWFMAAIGSAAI